MKLQSSQSAISWGVLGMHKEAVLEMADGNFVIQQGMKLLSSIYSFIHSFNRPSIQSCISIEIPFDLET